MTGDPRILHVDSDVVVIDKPAGVLTHQHQHDRHTPNIRSIMERLLGRPVYTVHRLDRGTSGVMILALTRESAARLSVEFRQRRVAKEYLAIVRGHASDTGQIETPLKLDTGETVDAVTRFWTLSRSEITRSVGRYDEAWFSLVRLELGTGRRHQARRHLHSINHPILGDKRHGDKAYNRFAADTFGAARLYLRATQIRIAHPVSTDMIIARTGVPEGWLEVLETLGLELPDLAEGVVVAGTPEESMD